MASAIEWSPSAVTFLGQDGAPLSRISSVAHALIVLEGGGGVPCRLSGIPLPLSSTDAANKAYVDSLRVFDTIEVRSGADSFSPSTGALLVSGGAGIAKNLHCGAIVHAVAFAATSDARLKTHIRNAGDVAAKLAGVRARKYEFLTQPGRQRYGVLAQDLLAADVDGSVFRADSGALSVDYNALTALLLDRVNTLESRVIALERGKSMK
jgi:hypothetical protein